MSPLGEVGQNDFGAGSQLEVAPHLIDPRAFAKCENGLLNDDGSIYKRGGSVAFGAAAFGTHGKMVWEGQMSVGRRTLIANEADFGVTATDNPGTAIVNLGGTGFPAAPKMAVYFQNILWIGGGTLYGGSRKAADYSTGTVAVTQGSKVITGSGTLWTANVDAGMLLRISSTERVYVVAQVISNTSIELVEAYEGATGSGKAYSLTRLAEATGPYKAREFYAVAGERLIAMEGRRIDFSEPNKPHLYKATIFPQETVVENFHELPEGVLIRGGFSVGVDRLIVCHTGGITTISNMAKSIVDGLGAAQHRIDVYSRDVVLWANPGIAATRSTFIVPAIDNIYLIDGVSAPIPLGDSIIPRLRERLLEGLTLGQAWVTREHYCLPILTAAGIPVDMLVCRLDKPFSYRNKTLYPWSFLGGAGALVGGATVRHPASAGELPRVLGASGDGKLVELLTWFIPAEEVALDHDGSTPVFSLLTRDYGVGDEGIHRWRKLQLFYELWPNASSTHTAVVAAEIGTGISEAGLPLWDEVAWDEFEWAGLEDGEFELLEGGAPPNAGLAGQKAQNQYVWYSKPYARHVRYRLTSADPVAKLVIRGLIAFPTEIGSARRSRVT